MPRRQARCAWPGRDDEEAADRALVVAIEGEVLRNCLPRGNCEMIQDDLVVSLSGEPAAKSQRGRGSSHAGACRRGIVTGCNSSY